MKNKKQNEYTELVSFRLNKVNKAKLDGLAPADNRPLAQYVRIFVEEFLRRSKHHRPALVRQPKN